MKLPSFKLNLVNVMNIAGALVVFYLAVVLGQTIMRNYALDQQIQEIKRQTVALEDHRDTLAYNIQYYQTEAFKEREARAKLGLQLPGEQVVILPQPAATPVPAPGDGNKPKRKPNFQQWLDFLAGRAS